MFEHLKELNYALISHNGVGGDDENVNKKLKNGITKPGLNILGFVCGALHQGGLDPFCKG